MQGARYDVVLLFLSGCVLSMHVSQTRTKHIYMHSSWKRLDQSRSPGTNLPQLECMLEN